MKAFLILTAILVTQALSQDSVKTAVSVFYFGGSDCAYCIDSTNVRNINLMRSSMPNVHQDTPLKFVLVVMDEDIERGIRFSRKYPRWDEVSIGKFYNNELMLEHVNRSQLPAVPHIMIYRDTLNVGKYGIPTIQKRTLLVDLVGESQISTWIKNGYPLKN